MAWLHLLAPVCRRPDFKPRQIQPAPVLYTSHLFLRGMKTHLAMAEFSLPTVDMSLEPRNTQCRCGTFKRVLGEKSIRNIVTDLEWKLSYQKKNVQGHINSIDTLHMLYFLKSALVTNICFKKMNNFILVKKYLNLFWNRNW